MKIFVIRFYFGSGVNSYRIRIRKGKKFRVRPDLDPHNPAPPHQKSRHHFNETRSPALKKGARYADLKGENQLEVEGGIAGGRVNGAEAEVLARVLRGRLAQDPAL